MSKRKVLFVTAFVLVLALALVPSAFALDEHDGDAGCTPALQDLADAMAEDGILIDGVLVDCDALVALREAGFGIGELRQAYRLTLIDDPDDPSEVPPGGDPPVVITFDELIEARSGGDDGDGLGWGQIKQAQAIAEAGLADFAWVIGMYEDGMGWGQLKKLEELDGYSGPPPWAKSYDPDNEHGPPSWAKNDKAGKANNGHGNGNNGGGNGNNGGGNGNNGGGNGNGNGRNK